MPYQDEMKAIKLLQDKAKNVESNHQEISSDLDEIKALLQAHTASLEADERENIAQEKEKIILTMSQDNPLKKHDISDIYAEAHASYDEVGLGDILSVEDFGEAQGRYNQYVLDFNKKYALDAWDYAIATSCGLFAAMLDIFFVSAPPKPTTAFDTKVKGTFNQWVQTAFNKAIPPESSICI